MGHAAHYAALETGAQTATLHFDGWEIRRSGVNGPFTVTNVHLVDLGAGGVPTQVAQEVWVTAAYGWRDFGFDGVFLPFVLRKNVDWGQTAWALDRWLVPGPVG